MAKARVSQTNADQHVCRDCVHVTADTKFNTLSLKGEPTLGRCPYYTDGQYCVLLSQKSCEHFKKKIKV